MLAIFESLLPIFLLIALGWGIDRSGLVTAPGWGALERLSYFVFFPVLLVTTLARADFGSLNAGGVTMGLLTGFGLMLAGMLVLRKPLQRALGLTPASYSSLYQTSTRWNAFIILAVVEKTFPPDALALVAIGIGILVIPINIVNIAVVAALGERAGPGPALLRKIATNPLILGVLAGLAIKLSGLTIYEPLGVALDLIARISLPMGLLIVGAGLKVQMPRQALAGVAAGAVIKLLVMPIVLAGATYCFGVRGQDLIVIALCGAGPSAMNGYLLARELGGDAPFYAAIVTLQTALSIFSLALVLTVGSYFAG